MCHGIVFTLSWKQPVRHLGSEYTRRNGIDAQTLGAIFDGCTAGDSENAMLTSMVGNSQRAAIDPANGRDIHDRRAFLFE